MKFQIRRASRAVLSTPRKQTGRAEGATVRGFPATGSNWQSAKAEIFWPKASVHTEVGAGHKTGGLVAGQENGRAHQFVSLAKPSHRGMAPNRFGPRRRRAIVVEQELAVCSAGKSRE